MERQSGRIHPAVAGRAGKLNTVHVKGGYWNRDLPLIMLLVSLGLTLRFFLIGHKSFWGDELYSAGLMGNSIPDLVRSSFNSSPHPPLAFVFTRIFAALFGTSEVSLRALQAIMSALASVPLFLFTKRYTGRMPALITGLLWTLSPYSVSLGQENWIYATLACFGFSFVYSADLCWRGNKAASFLIVPLGLTGMLVQHLFFLFLAAGFLLYFTFPSERRVPLKKFLLLSGIMALVYTPFAFSAIEQASIRAARLAGAGIAATAGPRMLTRIPTLFARLIPGGLAGELSGPMLTLSITSLIYVIPLCSVVLSLILMFLDKKIAIKLRIWMSGVLLIPLLLFLREDPTVRHLSILWIPFGFSVASLYLRHRPLAISLVVLAALMLFPYYRIDTFPLHRSNWREAVEIVLTRRTEQQKIVVLAGQNGGVAWDYYAENRGSDRIAPGGENPYETRPVSSSRSPVSVVDSLLSRGEEVWVVHDIWGGPVGADIAPDYDVLFREMPSPHMEVILFGN